MDMHYRPANTIAPIQLGDGLVLRHARPSDAEATAELVVTAHAATGNDAASAGPWTRDLIERPHPTMTAEDTFVVEHSPAGVLVSTLDLIPQIWTYDDVTLGVGRVELVATHPDYQGRGLAGRLFDVLHQWSDAYGHSLQAISGIPNFYRRFCYEYALSRGDGRVTHRVHVPSLAPGTIDAFHIRPTTEDDLPALAAIDRHAAERSLVACTRDAAAWRYELDGRSPDSMLHSTLMTLEAAPSPGDADHASNGKEVAGFAVLGSGGFPGVIPPGVAAVRRFEVAAGISWREATLSLLRHLARQTAPLNESVDQPPAYQEMRFMLGEEHPAYDAAPTILHRPLTPADWYIRVPDVPAFLSRIAPVLERRLATSVMAGYTGSLPISFYRSGVQLHFKAGRLAVEPWSGRGFMRTGAHFPGLTFLQLLLGYRSLSELEYAFPDCRARSEESRVLLTTLFPKSPSAVWPIG